MFRGFLMQGLAMLLGEAALRGSPLAWLQGALFGQRMRTRISRDAITAPSAF